MHPPLPSTPKRLWRLLRDGLTLSALSGTALAAIWRLFAPLPQGFAVSAGVLAGLVFFVSPFVVGLGHTWFRRARVHAAVRSLGADWGKSTIDGVTVHALRELYPNLEVECGLAHLDLDRAAYFALKGVGKLDLMGRLADPHVR